LFPLLGQPIIRYVVETASQATGSRPILVIGRDEVEVKQVIGAAADFAVQGSRLGTGDALRQAEDLLRGHADLILAIAGDMPLLSPETLNLLVEKHVERQARQQNTWLPMTMLTVLSTDSRGYGRVLRDADGEVQSVVEEADASPGQLAVHELNASVYCFDANWLWEALPRLQMSAGGEYYLTELVDVAVKEGLQVQAIQISDPSEAVGINTRVHLAEAEKILRKRVNQALMLAGVSIINPEVTYIEPDVEIGQDTVIWPNTYLQGKTKIGEGCTIGPNSILRDTKVGDRSQIIASMLEKAVVEDDVEIGPFARLRKGAHLAQSVHMGNFGEIKNSYLGPGVKMGHFSYIGDATIGAEVNIGAGTITCNFDGQKKNPTHIGEGAFIGSDTMLVAPVELGEGARTGAGSVVTKDVPAYSLAVGIPARIIRKFRKDK
jgi:bifunctional UDP-N-acetylglucosamine pyrophosphorylase/glucosamine-1-phosphate N-acetyltransferase